MLHNETSPSRNVKILAENHRNQQEKINLFEIGNIFISSSPETQENQSIIQHKMLSLLAVGHVINTMGFKQ